MTDSKSMATRAFGMARDNLDAKKMAKIAAAPQVEIPKLVATAALNNKKVRTVTAIISVFLPTIWNLILLATLITVILVFKPFEKIGLPQTAGYNALYVIGIYFPVSFFMNYGLSALTGKILKRM